MSGDWSAGGDISMGKSWSSRVMGARATRAILLTLELSLPDPVEVRHSCRSESVEDLAEPLELVVDMLELDPDLLLATLVLLLSLAAS